MCVIGGDFSEVRGEALFCLALTSPTRQPSLCYSFCSSEKWTLCSAQSTRASERIYRQEIKYVWHTFSNVLVNLMMNTLSLHPLIYLYCRNLSRMVIHVCCSPLTLICRSKDIYVQALCFRRGCNFLITSLALAHSHLCRVSLLKNDRQQPAFMQRICSYVYSVCSERASHLHFIQIRCFSYMLTHWRMNLFICQVH